MAQKLSNLEAFYEYMLDAHILNVITSFPNFYSSSPTDSLTPRPVPSNPPPAPPEGSQRISTSAPAIIDRNGYVTTPIPPFNVSSSVLGWLPSKPN